PQTGNNTMKIMRLWIFQGRLRRALGGTAIALGAQGKASRRSMTKQTTARAVQTATSEDASISAPCSTGYESSWQWSWEALTLAITGVQKQSEAALLHVRIDGVVRRVTDYPESVFICHISNTTC
ncbi:hypothetical protein, partial [Tepidimonas taiwanensis]|uniref:hypothetical protein n=1 Tax=Tepidimonas taiwanensis TaxID=307486 RepID=UPI001E64142B